MALAFLLFSGIDSQKVVYIMSISRPAAGKRAWPLTAYLGKIVASQRQIAALIVCNAGPIQHSGQYENRIDHRGSIRSLKVVFANGPNNSIYSAITFAEPIVPPVSFSRLSTLLLKKVHNNIKDLISVWRCNG